MGASFPHLLPAAPHARLQTTETALLSGLAFAAAWLLLASGYYPPAAVWQPAAVVIEAALMPLFLFLFHRRAIQRPQQLGPPYSCLQYLVRFYSILILFQLLLIALDGIGWGAKGIWAFRFTLLGTAVIPVSRILHGGAAPLPPPVAPARRAALGFSLLASFIFYVLALATFLTGTVLRANEAYPTDPTLLVLAFWLVALLLIICGASLWLTYLGILYNKRPIHQPLDDPPPPSAPPPPPASTPIPSEVVGQLRSVRIAPRG